MSSDTLPTLRALARNAVTWAIAWGLAGGALVGAVTLFDPNPAIESLPERVGMAVFAAVAWGVRFGLAGAVIGAGFAALVRFGFRGRRLADLSPLRFALLGAVSGGVGVPLYLQAMNLVTGGAPIAWGLVSDDAVWASVFGAVAAGGSILLARRAEALPSDRAEALPSDRVAAGQLPEAGWSTRDGALRASNAPVPSCPADPDPQQ